MASPSRRAERQKRRDQKRAQKAELKYTVCFHPDCAHRGVTKQECILCEQQGKSFAIESCGAHALEARSRLKRHVLFRHPGTIPAAMLAALRGDNE